MRLNFFLSVIVVSSFSVSAFAMGMQPPTGSGTEVVDREPVREGSDNPLNLPNGNFLMPGQMSVDLSKYDYLDQKSVVPTRAIEQATQFFELNRSRIKNKNYMTIIDFNQHATKARMYVVSMSTGAVSTYWVSAGSGSDPDGDGWATKFSNTPGSKMSSLGFYLTGGIYVGGNGRSMYLHGLQSSNSNAYSRAIVMHGADYVTAGRAGRSSGCPAVQHSVKEGIYSKIVSGSLLYIYK